MSKTHVDRNAEAAVLGAILLKPELLEDTILTEDSFCLDDLKLIFKTMLHLREQQKPIDTINIVHCLSNEQISYIGGTRVFLDLVNHAGSPDYFSSHETIVRENEFLRDAEQIYSDINLESLKFNDPKEYTAHLQEAIEKLESKIIKENTTESVSEMLENYDETIFERQKNGHVPGYPIISDQFDRKVGGAKKQDLIIIGARPSVGKTAFAVNIARMAGGSIKVDAVEFISIEMKKHDILDRIISGHSRIEGRNLENGYLTTEEWSRYTHGSIFLRQNNILINDKTHQTVENIVREIKALKKKHKEIMVIIDYLQEIQTERKFQSRREEVTYITRRLKQAARDYDCPVICISSLKRGEKRPTMADLKESGDIEFAADLIILLHRDDYFEKTVENNTTYSVMEVIVDKNRKGWTGVHEMVYERNLSNFLEMDRRETA
ncbi:DnaB-like helicase C-terminal domain-containing protein [Paenibacillus sp. FSL L8-0323]|uniref:replicative DNA helicase n=1 Tax=Paenibacillus sp. FSL L8-0323 TaxID=2975330 RepID=UPI0030FB0882